MFCDFALIKKKQICLLINTCKNKLEIHSSLLIYHGEEMWLIILQRFIIFQKKNIFTAFDFRKYNLNLVHF